ncbi:hypothetical protein QBC38DRAFT_485022 [Podospora fimiseda]|uniref:Carrier domain-containing protein n=1 Tax=Podospora fimiseda TaxID=252190 RepID=A0AAN7H047_9PEZI|nr:hypothetical protein QBC38DRAFT_485022 [Podospora fimiseda]
MRLVTPETRLNAEDLRPETVFADVAAEWLMSLALAEKLQGELGVIVKASLFVECPAVSELERWLET